MLRNRLKFEEFINKSVCTLFLFISIYFYLFLFISIYFPWLKKLFHII
jgi:hypothetical protein